MAEPSGGRGAQNAADRFAKLAIRRGISLGALQTSRNDFVLVLAAAAQGFARGEGYSEREVNEILRGFLAAPGAMLATDHVELRRWLIDFRLLERDGFGRVYTTGMPAPEFVVAGAQLVELDLAALAGEARARDAAARAERKERWEKSR
jgi:hypothetical protein